MHTGLMLLLVIVLVALNGLFVAAEFAFVKVRKTRVEILVQEGNFRARMALYGLNNLDAYLSVCQLGITLASLGLGWLGEPAVAQLLRPFLLALSVDNPALVSSLSIALGFIIITLIHVVLGELAPKTMAIQRAESLVLLLAAPLRVCYILWYPVICIMNGMSLALTRLLGFKATSSTEESHSPEELRLLILDSRKDGQLEETEGRMLSNIFNFYKKTATDVMVHRTDTCSLSVRASVDEAVELARTSGHTRLPVYEENPDNIIGFIHAKDLLHHDDAASLRTLTRSPIFAYETVHLDNLLRMMQEKKQQFCIVVDEYGVWQGIITMEDVVEVIVGDIQDEFDNEEPDFVLQPDGSALIHADLSLEDLALRLPLDKQETGNPNRSVAACILDALGKIPVPGDIAQFCGCRFTVVTMERHRIRRVRVETPPAPAE